MENNKILEKFPVGTMVCLTTEVSADYMPNTGKVVAHYGGRVIVNYTFSSNYDDLKKQTMYGYLPEDLMTEPEWEVEVERLTVIKQALEKEFEDVREEFKAKLAQATELVKETNLMAKKSKNGHYFLKSFYEDLFREIRAGGWSASDIKC